MNIFKALFGGNKENTEDNKKEQQKKDFEILKYDGVRALKTRQAEYAVKCFRHALDIKDDDETRDYLSQALIANNELLEAMNVLRELAEKISDNAAIYLRMASIAYMTDDYEAMYNACTKALEIESENYKDMYYQAVAAEGLGKRSEAIDTLTKIIDNAEDKYTSMLLRCELYLKDNQFDAAMNDVVTLDQENAENEDVLILKAKILHSTNKLDEAEEICTHITELDPFNIDAFSERATIRGEKGDKEGEKEDLQTVMELNPQETTHDDNPAETMQQKMKDSQINPLGL